MKKLEIRRRIKEHEDEVKSIKASGKLSNDQRKRVQVLEQMIAGLNRALSK